MTHSQDTSSPEAVTPNDKPAQVAGDYVLVPREPTEAMHDAARDWSYSKYGKPIGIDASAGCYRAMLAASPAIQAEIDAPDVPGAVTVKTLEWIESEGDDWIALSEIGLYRCGFEGGLFRVEFASPHKSIRQKILRVTGLVSAQAAAQADYSARILSAITPKPAPAGDDGALREALAQAEAERDLALYALNHSDFAMVGLRYPDDGMATCTGLNLDALAAAKRLREKGLVTIEDSGAGPIIRWAAGRGLAAQSSASQEPVAHMHAGGAIWRTDNGPPGIDFTKDGWVPLYALATPKTAGRAERLREALERLEKASTEVSRCGARTGSQWSRMDVAILRARAALRSGART